MNDEKLLLAKGYKEISPGVWSQEGGAHSHPPSGANAQRDKVEPKRRKSSEGKESPDVRTIALITVRTVRPRDYDGLGAASKHYMDGLRLCGLFPDDSPDHLEVLAVAERVPSFQDEETIIELYQIKKENL